MFWILFGLGCGALATLVASFFLGIHSEVGSEHPTGDSVSSGSHDFLTAHNLNSSSHLIDTSSHGLSDSLQPNYTVDAPISIDKSKKRIAIIDLIRSKKNLLKDTTEVYDGPGPYNFQNICSFFVGFGFSGAIFIQQGINLILSLILSSGIGFAIGFFLFSILKFFWKQQASSMIKNEDLIGMRAKTITRILSNQPGEILIELSDKSMEVLALPFDTDLIPADTNVIIIEINRDGIPLVSIFENNI